MRRAGLNATELEIAWSLTVNNISSSNSPLTPFGTALFTGFPSQDPELPWAPKGSGLCDPGSLQINEIFLTPVSVLFVLSF